MVISEEIEEDVAARRESGKRQPTVSVSEEGFRPETRAVSRAVSIAGSWRHMEHFAIAE